MIFLFILFQTKRFEYLLLLEMIIQQNQKLPKVFAIQVAGISCINCANNIKTLLAQSLSDSSLIVNVNVMQEKVYLTTNQPQTPDRAIEVLKSTKYYPINEPVLLSGTQENHRNIVFLVEPANSAEIEEKIGKTVGVVKVKQANRGDKAKLSVEYNCQMVRGRQLGDLIQSVDKGYQVINEKIQALSQRKRMAKNQHSIKVTITVWLYFLIVHMLFPVLPFTKTFYEECTTFPRAFGIYSFSVLLNILITLYVMQFYARGYIVRAYSNYKTLNTTNMETLIALGSLSAFSLSLFFIVRYSILGADHLHMAIMDINDALTSASVIVLTVTIGKHFEGRAKRQIERITDEIFPESVLFQNMKVQFAEMRNRQLKVVNQKEYDASLIEKGDILKIIGGSRILVDLIIIQGTVRAVQSARTGNDDIVHLNKGDRLQSGAIIYEIDGDCLAEVENVIENSLLLKLATHVKFAQNNQENSETGIQALCQKITNVFVRGVIALSLTTAAVWTVLITLQLVDIPSCRICWIFQRGISVLVASCPCALGLAVPSVIAIILKLAIKSGILIRSNRVFQHMKKVKKIAFDKTGTLFNRLQKIESHRVLCASYKEEEMWEMVALLEKELRHPLAEILYKEALVRSKVNGTNFNFILVSKPVQLDSGISAKILQKKSHQEIDILIGNKNIFSKSNVYLSQYESNSSTGIYLVADQVACMFIQLDTHSNLRPQAADVIDKIEKQNIEIHILSGDSKMSVKKLGHELKLNEESLHPECSSTDKEEWIKCLQADGKQSVIMVGDGLNDIPCLQAAGIGISINAKSELNINAADVIILNENLYKILALIRFLRRGNAFIKMNLFWAFAYNIVTMPIVAGAFYHWDIYVSPIWSCVAMSCSSLFVVMFSHLLVCFHYDDSLIEPVNNEYGIKYEGSSHIADSTRQVLGNSLSLRDEIP